MNFFRDEASDPRYNAQRNLSGRTHYVDDATLRFHKARVLSCTITDNGLLLAIVESVALDPNGMKRGFRPVIFDVFGEVLSRPKLEDSFSSRDAATKDMWKQLNKIDAQAHTLFAIDRQKERIAAELEDMRVKVVKLAC